MFGNSNYKGDKKVVEDLGSHYRLEGDNFFYSRRIGGGDTPLIIIGPGPNPDPRPIGVRVHTDKNGCVHHTNEPLLNKLDRGAPPKEISDKLIKEISDVIDNMLIFQ